MRVVFTFFYWMLAKIDPLVRAVWRRYGIGNTVDLVVVGRRTRLERHILVGLLHAGSGLYIGHPNGDVAWTLNLAAAGEGEVRPHASPPLAFRALLLSPGSERERAIRATWHQHPFPGNLVYWIGRGRIRAAGVFFRLEPLGT